MKILVWMSVGLFSAALSACGGSVGTGGDGGSGQGGGMAQSTSSQGSGMAQSSSGQGGGGSVCGGFAGTQCSADEYCDFPDDLCGAADGTGTCKPDPQGCPDIYMPVCACNGMVYSNSCDAEAAGQDVANMGACTPPAGMFPCGPVFCAKGQQYCNKTGSDVPDIPDSYLCATLPPSCGLPATCACLDNVCGAPMQNCSASPDGDLTVVCPGG